MVREVIARRKISFVFFYLLFISFVLFLLIIIWNYNTKKSGIKKSIVKAEYNYDIYSQFLKKLKNLQENYYYSEDILDLELKLLRKMVWDKKKKEDIIKLIFLSRYKLKEYGEDSNLYYTLGECFFLLGEKEYQNSLNYYNLFLKESKKISLEISLKIIFLNLFLENYKITEQFAIEKLKKYSDNIDLNLYYIKSLIGQKKNIKAYKKIEQWISSTSLENNEKILEIFNLLFFLLEKFNLNNKIDYYYEKLIELTDYEFQFVKKYSYFLANNNQKRKAINLVHSGYKKKKKKKYFLLLKQIYKIKN